VWGNVDTKWGEIKIRWGYVTLSDYSMERNGEKWRELETRWRLFIRLCGEKWRLGGDYLLDCVERSGD